MIVWAGAALLALGLAWLEARRADRRHRLTRVALVILAVSALASLLRPPRVWRSVADAGVVILVTPGTSDSLLRAVQDSLPGMPQIGWPDSVPDLEAVRRRFPDAGTLVVTGWGLREPWWDGHNDLVVHHAKGILPPGFAPLRWPREMALGSDAFIEGEVTHGTAPTQVTLEGPGGVIDSVAMDPDSSRQFRFRISPSAAGRARYVLSAPGAPDESLGISVAAPGSLSILIVEGTPAFETNFLRRWLERQGATVAIRSRLSRDRDRVERLNLEAIPLRPLTPALLARFDLVMMDGASLAELGTAERRALDAAVREEGLGLLLAPDSLVRAAGPMFPFDWLPVGGPEDRLVRPRWDGRTDRSTTAIPTAPAELRAKPGQRELAHDPVGRVMVAMARLGVGRVATSLLLEPSRWQLEGEAAAFGAYWSMVIDAVARGRGERWDVVTDGPVRTQHAVSLLLSTVDPRPVAVVTGPDGTADTLGLAQDLSDPARWWGRFWPRSAGWHGVTNRGGATYHFDVEAPRESALEAAARLGATARRAALSPPPQAGPTGGGRRRPLGPLVPFVILVAALAALWAEGRGLWTAGRTATPATP